VFQKQNYNFNSNTRSGQTENAGQTWISNSEQDCGSENGVLKNGDLEYGGLGTGLCLGLRLHGIRSDGANVEAHGGKGCAADAVGDENSEGQRGEAGAR
jgi:hypothetical protein